MGNNTFNNTFNKEASVAQGDNATANQYIYGSKNEALNEKLDAMFSKLDKTQAVEMEKLTGDLFKLIDERLIKTNKLSEKQVEEFKAAKFSDDTKFKLKVGLPLSQLTGITAEVEKEWKLSKEIKAESVISFLRNVIQREELQITKFNEIETE
jgi:hypothetical protein